MSNSVPRQIVCHPPSINHTHTMTLQTRQQASPDPSGFKVATVELQVQACYKLFIEPQNHTPVEPFDSILTPKFPTNFKLSKLPISSDLAHYLKPHILQNAFGYAQRYPNTEFKLLFDVKCLNIQLINY
ncbi:hypothetical protein RJT34_15375 [Clitoria ternatea]|uniref:Uncharacterized protein n=1 Tax=Clitoria ternatea TaxID=43366 RepID=A0AAN9JS94_CLITE